MTTRENVEDKGRRYLAEARLTVTKVDGDVVLAECRGAGQVHQCGHQPRRGWHCSCPARGICSHLTALQLVTVRRQR
jgi:hypothetical protein